MPENANLRCDTSRKRTVRSFRSGLLLILIFLAILIWSPSESAQSAQLGYSQQEVFQAIWQTVNSNFYDPCFLGVDWKEVEVRYRSQVEKIKDDKALLALMRKMLGELPVSHLRLVESQQQQEVGINIRTYMVEGRRVVAFVGPLSDAKRHGLGVGDIILTPWNQVIGPVGTSARMRIRGSDKREREVSVLRQRVAFPAGLPPLRWQVVEVQPGQQIGYLRAENFNEISPAEIDSALADLKDTNGLIIDVRDNPGGNISFIYLASYLSPGEHLVASLLTRRFLERTGCKLDRIRPDMLSKMIGVYTTEELFARLRQHGAVSIYTKDLGDKVYSGKVVVLINEGTGSSAEGFAAFMKNNTKAVLIGRATAGALVSAQTFTLANGWQLFLPTAVSLGSDGRVFKDSPITPQVEVNWILQDFYEGRDPNIGAALNVLTGDKLPRASERWNIRSRNFSLQNK
jgi:carboxyl-terminal processing protease